MRFQDWLLYETMQYDKYPLMEKFEDLASDAMSEEVGCWGLASDSQIIAPLKSRIDTQVVEVEVLFDGMKASHSHALVVSRL